jgi:hypothetical protein
VTHPIVALQGALVAALRDATEFKVFDAPPVGQVPPYLTIARHDVLPRDGDEAPGHEHHVVLHAWAGEASRKAALELADAVTAATLEGELTPDGLTLTLRRHDRTETVIDTKTGRARAAIALTFYTEPA